MKSLKIGAICVLLSLCAFRSFAQQPKQQEQNLLTSAYSEPDYNKPKLFADLPERMTLDVAALETLFSLEVSKPVNLFVAKGFNFHGVIVSKSNAADQNSQSVVVKSSNRQGAILTFTRNRNSGGSFYYIGRILSLKHGDAYEIKQEEDGSTVLLKKDLYDLISD